MLRAEAQMPFEFSATNNDEKLGLAEADYVIIITSNSSQDPRIFQHIDEIPKGIVTLSLAGYDVPDSYIDHVLKNGTVICDDIAGLTSRNIYALPLFFSERGQNLEAKAEEYGIRELADLLPKGYPQVMPKVTKEGGEPVFVTCTGLGSLDVWIAIGLLKAIASATRPMS